MSTGSYGGRPPFDPSDRFSVATSRGRDTSKSINAASLTSGSPVSDRRRYRSSRSNNPGCRIAVPHEPDALWNHEGSDLGRYFEVSERLRVGVPHGHWIVAQRMQDLRRRAHPAGLHRSVGSRWRHQPDGLRNLHRQGPGPGTQTRRRRRHGQPVEPQGTAREGDDRSGRIGASVSAALQPRLQSDRECLLQAQGAAQESRRANRIRVVERHRSPDRTLPTGRMCQLLQSLRIRCNLIGFRSNHYDRRNLSESQPSEPLPRQNLCEFKN